MKTESSANGRRPRGRDSWPFESYGGSSLLKADRQLERMALKLLVSFHTPLDTRQGGGTASLHSTAVRNRTPITDGNLSRAR